MGMNYFARFVELIPYVNLRSVSCNKYSFRNCVLVLAVFNLYLRETGYLDMSSLSFTLKLTRDLHTRPHRWPAIIQPCPDNKKTEWPVYRLEVFQQVRHVVGCLARSQLSHRRTSRYTPLSQYKYHVTFCFDTVKTHAWLPQRHVAPFSSPDQFTHEIDFVCYPPRTCSYDVISVSSVWQVLRNETDKSLLADTMEQVHVGRWGTLTDT